MDINRIAQIICSVAESENKELSDISQEGIFHMPELAFAYECGKAIIKESKSIFGETTVEWCRECDLKNGGPTDLVFKLGSGYTIAIEFKLRDTTTAYQNDIEKLGRIKEEKCIRLFCALVDVFNHQLPDDGRQVYIECLPNYQVKPLHKVTFDTKQSRYVKPVSCVACVWEVGQSL
ncbi:hypothetical protein A6E13_19095 [Aliivibrio fischeri]|uniref:hypothetical protein n=1 Tax=Aliivibrio fischeri TaxID=668 RepID=UPI00080EBBE5|nr:hypothetical protein [Aliivibrio fischeri]OCH29970.1 hypothetical protein A6E13_19095 [Aliivibrio fischeri]